MGLNTSDEPHKEPEWILCPGWEVMWNAGLGEPDGLLPQNPETAEL